MPHETLEIGRDRFFEQAKRHDAVHGAHAGHASGGDGGEIVDVGFHHVGRAQPV